MIVANSTDRIGTFLAIVFVAMASALLFLGGWYARGDAPRTAARCRASGYVRFVPDGDHVIVRCSP